LQRAQAERFERARAKAAPDRRAARKMKKRTTKRTAGKRLNKEGRLSPLDVFQTRMEHYNALAAEEIELGDLGSREKIGEYLELAQKAGEALAPYRHARLTPAEAADTEKKKYVIRAPGREFKSPEEWLAAVTSRDSGEADAKNAEDLVRRFVSQVPDGKLN
jgi:hypothetical protein